MNNIEDVTPVRARMTLADQKPTTTGVVAYAFTTERENNRGHIDKRTFITLKEVSEHTRFRFSWSQAKALHQMLGDLIEENTRTPEAWERHGQGLAEINQ